VLGAAALGVRPRDIEIDDAEGAARREHPERVVDGAEPVGNHGQRIREVHAIHCPVGPVGGGVRFDDAHIGAPGESAARDLQQRRAEVDHLGTGETVEPCAEEIEVAAGAAPQLDHGRTRTGRQMSDQFLTPVQQALAEGVVGVGLRAVEAAEPFRMTAAAGGAAQQVEQDASVGERLHRTTS
jgi:hypothetical protein